MTHASEPTARNGGQIPRLGGRAAAPAASRPTIAPTRKFSTFLAWGLACVAVSAGLRAWSAWVGVADDAKAGAWLWSLDFGVVNARGDAALVAAAMALLVAAASLRPGWARPLAAVWVAFTGACVVLAWVNALALTAVGRPLTFQWLYYADFFRSFTSQSAVAALVSGASLAILAAALLVWAIAAIQLRAVIVRLALAGPRRALAGLAALSGVYVLTAVLLAPRYAPSPWVAVNPLAELVASGWAAWADTGLGDEPVVPPPPLPPPSRDPALLPPALRSAEIRNVLVIVMESVGARFVAGFGPAEAAAWTPSLAAQLPHSIAFTRFFSHVPMSTKSLFSMLTGRYPVFSFETETTLLAGQPLRTLPEALRASGRRTALFMSGDLEFQNVETFLGDKGFDRLADMRTIPCAGPVNRFSSAPSHLDAVDDGCTASALLDWIRKDGDAPFFGLMWTGNTHFPYFAGPDAAPAGRPNSREQYLAALRSSDAAIGRVVAGLAASGRLHDTLIAVVGDHGESFGEHGEAFHGGNIFNEQVHVPLLLIHPSIQGPVVDERVGGMIDLAPTLLHVAQPEAALPADGRSLFDPHRSAEIFLFAPNQSMVAGYIRDNHKYMFDLRRRQAGVYDLASDPGETSDVIAPGEAALIRRTLAGWRATQRAR